jgi:uncharacterized protein YkwD
MEDFIRLSTIFVAIVLAASCSGNGGGREISLLSEHNRARSEFGLDPLAVDPSLCEYAQDHAKKMASRGRLVHSSMSSLAVVSGTGDVAENIACGQKSEEEAMSSWMKSPGHRRNILSKRYKRLGFGMKEDSDGTNYWCVVFAS